MVGIVVDMPQVSSTRRKIVRSRELALINVPLCVNEDGGHPVAGAQTVRCNTYHAAPHHLQVGGSAETVLCVGCQYTLLMQNFFFPMCPVRSYLSPVVIVRIRPCPCSRPDPQLLFGVNRAMPVTLCYVDTNPST